MAYLYQILLGILAFAALMKDWRDYAKVWEKPRRLIPATLAIVAIVATMLAVRETYSDSVERTKNQAKIGSLSDQIKQLGDANTKNADGFRKSFGELYDKFSALQSQVQTKELTKQNKELLKRLGQAKQELIETQTKLTPIRITLVATFPTLYPSNIPIKEITLPLSNGVVNVPFWVYNPSDVNSGSGQLVVRLPNDFNYASEPPGFTKTDRDSDREFSFAQIWAKAGLETMTIPVKVPSNYGWFTMNVAIGCEHCMPIKEQILKVILSK